MFGKSFSRCQPAAGRTELTSLSVTSLSSSSSFFHLLPFRSAPLAPLRLSAVPLARVSFALLTKILFIRVQFGGPRPCVPALSLEAEILNKKRREREREIEGKKDDYQHCSVSLSAQFNRLRLNEANCLIHRDYSESNYLQECSAKLTRRS